MDKMKIVQAILCAEDSCYTTVPQNNGSFLEIGKVYAVRTVTMIYTGRLKAVNSQEFLFDEVAWIPETERWESFAKDGSHKEAEPYSRPVIIGRGGLLDATEIPSVIRKQK